MAISSNDLKNLNWTSLGNGDEVHNNLTNQLRNPSTSCSISELYATVIITCPKNHRAYIPGGNVRGLRNKSTQVGHVGLAV